jgi:hypothetical protein
LALPCRYWQRHHLASSGTGFAFCLIKAGYFTQIACRLRELD